MKLKKRMILRKIFRAVGIGTALLAAAVALFIAVSWAVEYRPGERETTICCPEGEIVPLPDTLTILSWNIGYAGLGDNMDFFYDGGRRVRDSRERTARNLKEIVETISRVNPDIALLQEVDLDSRRSYRIREVDTLRAAFPGYTLAFAYNYKVCWVPVPLRAPLGRVQAGVVTLSRYAPVSTVRYGYPSAFGFPVRLFNLKRCLLEAEFVTRGGDTVWIGNTHNTAYDTGGMRSDEMRFLGELLRAASLRGVRSVTGGDWNQYPPGYEPFRGRAVEPLFRSSGGRLVADRAGLPFRVRSGKADAALSGPALCPEPGRYGASDDDADRLFPSLRRYPRTFGRNASARVPVERSRSRAASDRVGKRGGCAPLSFCVK